MQKYFATCCFLALGFSAAPSEFEGDLAAKEVGTQKGFDLEIILMLVLPGLALVAAMAYWMWRACNHCDGEPNRKYRRLPDSEMQLGSFGSARKLFERLRSAFEDDSPALEAKESSAVEDYSALKKLHAPISNKSQDMEPFQSYAQVRPISVPTSQNLAPARKAFHLKPRGRPGKIKTVPVVITGPAENAQGTHFLTIEPLKTHIELQLESETETFPDAWFTASYSNSPNYCLTPERSSSKFSFSKTVSSRSLASSTPAPLQIEISINNITPRSAGY